MKYVVSITQVSSFKVKYHSFDSLFIYLILTIYYNMNDNLMFFRTSFYRLPIGVANSLNSHVKRSGGIWKRKSKTTD